MRLKDLPIRKKLMSMIMLISAVVLLLMCGVYITFEIVSSRNSIQENVTILGRITASNSSAALAFDNPADANEILNGLKANDHIVAACLYDKNGKLFATYPASIAARNLPASPGFTGYRVDKGFLIGFQPVVEKNEFLGTLYIRSDMEAMYSRLRLILFTAGILFVGLLIIAYILSKLLQKTISSPILALEQTAKVISAQQNYAVRAVKQGRDEVGSLTDAFNQMLSQIEKQNLEIRHAQEASSKLAAIVESSDDAIIGQTLDGVITSWNKSAERMFGYQAEEILGESIFKLIPDTRRDEGRSALKLLQNGERVDSFETQRRVRNNELMYVSVTISPVYDSDGKVTGLSEIARDITEKKQEEIRKNDFIAIVSHELKTPLTSLRSYIQVLLGMARKTNADFSMHALTRAEIQIKKMTNMVQDFLNLARLENGKIQLNKEEFELQPLMQELVLETQFLTSNHTVKFDECAGLKVLADREKISQVMINLLSNAIKYSPKGGTILMSCKRNENKVRIAVSDEGVGISPEDQKKLFDRFYRVKNDKVKTVSGFGIGLYLVSEIIKSHDNRIGVSSQEGAGSTFYFDLDLYQAPVLES